MDKANHLPTIFSGIKPSGDMHIGNYLGAMSQWPGYQEKYRCIFCVVDYHAITVKQEPEKLKRRSLEIVKHYIASGIDPKVSKIFLQSDLSEHAELAWILNCIARISDLNKMTQFKEKTGDKKENASVGLYDYPALMAADILLYQTEIVPVGEDQVQHVELTKTLARRFNERYGEVFKVPEAVIKKEGARIMSLDDGTKKMGKSELSASSSIYLLDDPEAAAKKIMRAETDSGNEIKYEKNSKPAISNLLTIYSLFSGKSIKSLEQEYKGKGYGDFKKGLAATVKTFLSGYQKKYDSISDQEARKIMKDGAEALRPIAKATLGKVKEKIGILNY